MTNISPLVGPARKNLYSRAARLPKQSMTTRMALLLLLLRAGEHRPRTIALSRPLYSALPAISLAVLLLSTVPDDTDACIEQQRNVETE